MPKCRKCGLEVTQNKSSVWGHVDDGQFSHSAEPVSLGVAFGVKKKATTYASPVRPPLFGDSNKYGGGKNKNKANGKGKKFGVVKYLEGKAVKRGRLPDKSRFDISYNAATKTWSGVLIVDGFGVFEGIELGAFLLLNSLDGKYREAVGKVDSKAGK